MRNQAYCTISPDAVAPGRAGAQAHGTWDACTDEGLSAQASRDGSKTECKLLMCKLTTRMSVPFQADVSFLVR